jgi:hypothetical protein
MAYPRRQITDEMRRVITENTNRDAAKILGVCNSTISAICRAEGIKSRPTINADGTPRGATRAEICSMWTQGATVAEICAEYDMRASVACAVLCIPTLSGIALYLSEDTCKRLDRMTPAGVGRDEYVAEIIASFVGNGSV